MKLKIALIGAGTVGQGFLALLKEKEGLLKNNFSLEVEISALADLKYGNAVFDEKIEIASLLNALEKNKKVDETFHGSKKMDTEALVKQADYDILLELTFTNLDTGQPAFSFIKEALLRGKHVITTNKGPIALYLDELKKLAKEKTALLKYEGTVMSGTPLINLAQKNLAGLEIKKIEGILNGTSNYIFTEMKKGTDYDKALKKARELGYAEADPTADVEGWDAVAKVMILLQDIFDKKLKKNKIERKGITGITLNDIKKAERENSTWRLIANLEKKNGEIKVSVKPEKISNSHPLAGINGATNALTFTTDYLQQVTISGPGAGKFETGYAVLNDLISIHNELMNKKI